jgi:hypothetical protein
LAHVRSQLASPAPRLAWQLRRQADRHLSVRNSKRNHHDRAGIDAQTQTNAPAAPGAKSGTTAQDTKAAPQQAQDKPASANQPKSAASPAADTKTKASTTGSAPSAAGAAPSPEKRSQIASAIKHEKITEIKNVNFNISIGARVPSTIQFYPLPTRIIEIYPEWRGYQVILVGGRYVVVRPNTYEIVYIIEG